MYRPYTPTSPLPPELLPSQTPPPLSFFGQSWKKILQIYLLSCANFYLEIKSLIFFQLCSWSSPPYSFNFSSPSSATTPPLKPSWTWCQKSDESLPAFWGLVLPCTQKRGRLCPAANLHLRPQCLPRCSDQLLQSVSHIPTILSPT